MSKILSAKAVETKEGTILEVEVPGYTKDDISIEVKPYSYSLLSSFGFDIGAPVSGKKLVIEASNKTRGYSILNVDIVENYIDLEEIEASVLNGFLTIKLPFKKKHQRRIIPVG